MERKLKTIGEFSREFLDWLPALEQKMIENGLDPEDFSIVKDQDIPSAYGFSIPYTVTVQGQSFTVNMLDDMKFLEYFYGICFPPEETAQMHPKEHKLLALLQRMEKQLMDNHKDKLNE